MCEILLKTSKLLVVILILIHIENLLAGRSRKNLLDTPRFKAFSCEFSEEMKKQLYENTSCGLAKIDKNLYALNMYIGFKIPTYHLYAQCTLFFKSDGIFREVVSIPEFDWCLVGKTDFDGFLLQQLTEMVKRFLPYIMSECPRKQVAARNLTFPSHKFFTFLPTGLYKFVAGMRFDQKGPNMYNMTGQFVFDSFKDKIGS